MGEKRGRSWRAGRAADRFDCQREVVGVGRGQGEAGFESLHERLPAGPGQRWVCRVRAAVKTGGLGCVTRTHLLTERPFTNSQVSLSFSSPSPGP